MKKFQTTFILLGVMVVLLLIVVFFASEGAEKKRNQLEKSGSVLSERQVSEMDEVVFSPQGEDSVTLKKNEQGVWTVNDARVDQDEEEKLFKALEEFPQGKQVSRSETSWAEYGLTNELASKVILKDEEKEALTVFFGTSGPGYGSVYVRRNAAPEVFVLETELDDLARYGVDRWVNKHLFLVEKENVQGVIARVGEEKWQFRLESGKWEQFVAEAWKSLEKPEDFQTYLDALLSVKADAVESDVSKFETADNAVALTLKDGTEYVVSVDKKSDSESYAKATGLDGLLKLTTDLSARLKWGN